jgi:hypothetical protein
MKTNPATKIASLICFAIIFYGCEIVPSESGPTTVPTAAPTPIPTAMPTAAPTAVPTLSPEQLEIHYDSDSAGVYAAPPRESGAYLTDFEAHIRIKPADIDSRYIGKKIWKVKIYLGSQDTSPVTSLTLKIYDVPTAGFPGVTGTIGYSQVLISPFVSCSWNEFQLTTPIVINSDYFWVGFEFLMPPSPGLAVFGIDDGAVPNADGAYYENSTTSVWGLYTFDKQRNLKIRAEVED